MSPSASLAASTTQPLNALDQLQHFLRHAPALFSSPMLPASGANRPLVVRLHLPLSQHHSLVSCIFYDNRFLISSIDILRVLLFRFRCLARPIASIAKFKEGVFSYLRNVKPGAGARLEVARSPLLDTLFRLGCVRTQKRQKIFFWDAVDHDQLFRDTWNREMRREMDALAASMDAPGPVNGTVLGTAVAWQSTRPLLITYIRSLGDPTERSLNAASSSNRTVVTKVQASANPNCNGDWWNGIVFRSPAVTAARVEPALLGLAIANPFVSDLPAPIPMCNATPLVHLNKHDVLSDPLLPIILNYSIADPAPVTNQVPPFAAAEDISAAVERQLLMDELEAFLTPPKKRTILPAVASFRSFTPGVTTTALSNASSSLRNSASGMLISSSNTSPHSSLDMSFEDVQARTSAAISSWSTSVQYLTSAPSLFSSSPAQLMANSLVGKRRHGEVSSDSESSKRIRT